MTLDKWIVTIAGVAGVALTYWFFLVRQKEKGVRAGDQVDIVVEGGYAPDVIRIPRGKTTAIRFTRKDPSSCLEEVVISDFKVRKYLPMHEPVTIELTPEKTGTYRFTCGMQMNHGTIIVE